MNQVRRRRILIVEDNPDSADSLKMLLDELGHETHLARDGPTGVYIAATVKPDVIVMDIGLPGLNGYDAARKIRAQVADVPMLIIALSGWGQDSDRERSKDAGIDHHLVKPLQLTALLKLIDSQSQFGAR